MNRKRNILIIVLPITAIVVAGIFGFVYYKNFQKPKVDAIVPTPVTKVDTTNWKTYRNEKYGFGFLYPSDWGDVQEKIMAYGPNEYERGKSYLLTFSGNLQARGGGISSDFTRPMDGNDETFRGDSQKPKNINSSIYVSLPGCEERYFQTYNGWVEFNLPGKEISGFRLILPILSQTEIQKFSFLYPISGDGSCLVGSKELEQAQQHAGDILKKIETGDIDKESRENLQIFKDVVKSAYVF